MLLSIVWLTNSKVFGFFVWQDVDDELPVSNNTEPQGSAMIGKQNRLVGWFNDSFRWIWGSSRYYGEAAKDAEDSEDGLMDTEEDATETAKTGPEAMASRSFLLLYFLLP
jgi:hypothetical protein